MVFEIYKATVAKALSDNECPHSSLVHGNVLLSITTLAQELCVLTDFPVLILCIYLCCEKKHINQWCKHILLNHPGESQSLGDPFPQGVALKLQVHLPYQDHLLLVFDDSYLSGV